MDPLAYATRIVAPDAWAVGYPPNPHEAYVALRTALCGSGVLTLQECERWARRIVAETQGET